MYLLRSTIVSASAAAAAHAGASATIAAIAHVLAEFVACPRRGLPYVKLNFLINLLIQAQ